MAENTTDLDAVMQAAERLRRWKSGGDSMSTIYGPLPRPVGWTLEMMLGQDKSNLADFALSILPKGKRPVAIEQPEQCCARRSIFDADANRVSAWGFDLDDGEVFSANCHCLSCWTKETFRVQFYRTEEEALLARRWHHLTT